jgi:dihydrofolate synthase/folylpolyglutamate synthase
MAKVHYSQNTYNLKRMKWLLQTLGNPQDKLRCIHIAGTKGKGSTAIMLATILAQAGYKVGIYTSPHLIDLRERIQVWHMGKQTLISKNDFTELMNHFVFATKRSTLYALRPTPYARPTFFETMTALAFLHFKQKKVDFAVFEVGLGGRLDATNLITPIVSVITRIDLDHTDKLGHTIKEIAYEKAGIIKPGVPVITFRQMTSADEVIREKAKTQKAPLHIAKTSNRKLGLLGCHQKENYSLAAGVIKLLNTKGYTKINQGKTNESLKGLILPARLELINRNPDIILDSAHNPVSIRATADTVKKLKYHKVIVIFALSADKEIGKIVNSVITLADIIIFTRTNHPRLLPPQEFIKYLPKHSDKTILIEPDYTNALSMARRLAHADDLILITGSFYLAGEMKKLLKNESR